MLKAYAVPDGAATTHGTVQQRRRGTVQQRRTDGAAHAHDAAITHDAATTRARRGTMCMLLLGVVLLAVAINTCTYFVGSTVTLYTKANLSDTRPLCRSASRHAVDPARPDCAA